MNPYNDTKQSFMVFRRVKKGVCRVDRCFVENLTHNLKLTVK